MLKELTPAELEYLKKYFTWNRPPQGVTIKDVHPLIWVGGAVLLFLLLKK